MFDFRRDEALPDITILFIGRLNDPTAQQPNPSPK